MTLALFVSSAELFLMPQLQAYTLPMIAIRARRLTETPTSQPGCHRAYDSIFLQKFHQKKKFQG
jgi:hypothetical protein